LSIAGIGSKFKPFFIFCGNENSEILFERINEMSQFIQKEAYFATYKNG
jgi:hypothetical protein